MPRRWRCMRSLCLGWRRSKFFLVLIWDCGGGVRAVWGANGGWNSYLDYPLFEHPFSTSIAQVMENAVWIRHFLILCLYGPKWLPRKLRYWLFPLLCKFNECPIYFYPFSKVLHLFAILYNPSHLLPTPSSQFLHFHSRPRLHSHSHPNCPIHPLFEASFSNTAQRPRTASKNIQPPSSTNVTPCTKPAKNQTTKSPSTKKATSGPTPSSTKSLMVSKESQSQKHSTPTCKPSSTPPSAQSAGAVPAPWPLSTSTSAYGTN